MPLRSPAQPLNSHPGTAVALRETVEPAGYASCCGSAIINPSPVVSVSRLKLVVEIPPGRIYNKIAAQSTVPLNSPEIEIGEGRTT